jgi:queuine/archaeosine tRNA-ribosyltransferase
MNKARRHELKMLKYKKRIQKFAAKSDIYVTRSGDYIYNPKTVDIIKDNGQLHYRSHSTPCSCYMCSPYKYNRAKVKAQYRKPTIRLFE